MFPNSNGQQAGSNDLEGRLRSMILTNADANVAAPNPVGTGDTPPPPGLPPHMFTAPPAEQQAYLAQVDSRQQTQPQQNPPLVQAAPAGNKRLNQAQRRQMNAELSIPIDPRQAPSTQGNRPNYQSNHHQPPGKSPNFNNQHQLPQKPRYQNHQQFLPEFSNGQVPPYFSQGGQPSPMNHQNHQAHGSGQGYQRPQNYSPHFQQQYSPGVGLASPYGRPPPPQNRQIYNPGPSAPRGRAGHGGFQEEKLGQSAHLDRLVHSIVPTVGVDADEEAEKESFRAVVEQACREAIGQYENDELQRTDFDLLTVELRCFGSMSSGFATKASDMDLALLTPLSNPAAESPESAIPRVLEKKLLNMGFGARLLTRTRVPIIKLCQKPTEKLYADLLEERTKWETEFVDEEPVEDKPADGKQSPQDITKDHPSSDVHPSPTQDISHVMKDDIAKLKQKDDQSLGDYFNQAKRTLRILGGREVSVGLPTFTDEEGSLMNDVCKAFITGLKSEDLIQRLQGYQSIAPLFESSPPQLHRSLAGVLTQVEGEKMAMEFENRPITEREDRREHECRSIVEDWRSLQNRSNFISEPLPYNRLLYVAAEKLKTISSLQLIFLSQVQHEEPLFYQKRVRRIIYDLKSRGPETDTVTPIVITHYLAGINNPSIRDTMTSSNLDRSNLEKLCLQHRVLQLACDYEHALKKDLFEVSARADVEKYVTLLREQTMNGGEIDADLVAIIRALPDPTTISQSKPRDRYKDHLEFPKQDIGVQCDINFSAELALQNTLLLRCYSHCDPRVKLLILFVKQWAKVRGINSSYRGTLSSYGYVLMVLHYLVNIAQPFVCPNLQLFKNAQVPTDILKGRDVRFWKNEAEIRDLSARGLLNHNHDNLGLLVRGFFEYFAQGGQMSTVNGRGFDWGREVLSLRSQGGIISKQSKGWTGAKSVFQTSTVAAPPTPSTPAHPVDSQQVTTPPEGASEVKLVKQKTMEETKEIRHRYLFAIEDPFELDHNVARTVTHDGIVSIRDEFRRAWGIIRNLDRSYQNANSLMEPVSSPLGGDSGWNALLDLIHGPQLKREVVSTG